MTLSSSQSIQTDTWIKATWADFVAVVDDPQYEEEESRGYFDNGYMRIETAPLGAGHSRQNNDFQLPGQDNSPIDVTRFGPPTLVIEVGSSSFKDDLGAKRLLYERLGIAEYWVVNVTEKQVIAFSIADSRSGEIRASEVLPGLEITLVEEALQRSQTEDDSTLMRWLMDTLR